MDETHRGAFDDSPYEQAIALDAPAFCAVSHAGAREKRIVPRAGLSEAAAITVTCRSRPEDDRRGRPHVYETWRVDRQTFVIENVVGRRRPRPASPRQARQERGYLLYYHAMGNLGPHAAGGRGSIPTAAYDPAPDLRRSEWRAGTTILILAQEDSRRKDLRSFVTYL